VRFSAAAVVIALLPALGRAACPPVAGLPGDPPSWCEATSRGADGMAGTGDDRTDCIASAGVPPMTDCATHESTRWTFRDGDDWCSECRYVFYVAVSAGRELHLPFDDVDAMSVQVRDMGTPTADLQWLEGENEAARRSGGPDEFLYCDACSLRGEIVARDDGDVGGIPGTCILDTPLGRISTPVLPSLPSRQSGTTIAWGVPTDPANPDADGDGNLSQAEMRVPPCDRCDAGPCPCGSRSGNHRVARAQVFDVVVRKPSVAGVHRVEIVSGDVQWDLVANCDGSPAPQLVLYDSCAAATAAWVACPQLALGDGATAGFEIVDLSGCPAVATYAVTTCNTGGAASGAPFRITLSPGGGDVDGDNTQHPSDPACQVPLAPGECRTCEWIVPVAGATLASLQLDPDDVVAECDVLATADCAAALPRADAIPACARRLRSLMSMGGGGTGAPGSVRMAWRGVPAHVRSLRVHAGTIASLRSGRYDHSDVLACGLLPSEGFVDVVDPLAGRYYLLAEVDGADVVTLGLDSRGEPIPELPAISPCR
jgi:hypothetical protein